MIEGEVLALWLRCVDLCLWSPGCSVAWRVFGFPVFLGFAGCNMGPRTKLFPFLLLQVLGFFLSSSEALDVGYSVHCGF